MKSASTTAQRRQAIHSILESVEVQSQGQLIELLAGSGHSATQPVLSRDLRALNVAKQGGVYQILESERVTPLEHLQSLLRGSRPAGDHLEVVRCEPGAASAVARALEAEGLEGIVGTVAGDDTVFVAVDSKLAGEEVRRRVGELVATS